MFNVSIYFRQSPVDMLKTDLTITSLGRVARQILGKEQAVSILGITSRGVYLLTSSQWVLYISREGFRGPLTLNLQAEFLPIEYLQSTVFFTVDDRLIINDLEIHHPSGLKFHFGGSEVWEIPPRPECLLPLSTINSRSAVIWQKVPGYLSRGSDNHEIVNFYVGFFHPLLHGLSRASDSGKIPRLVEAIQPLVGFGPGLTPAGDDFIIGILLTLNRWGAVIHPELDLMELNQAVLEIINSRTSTLSANLIQCAVLGEADERLIHALDGLMTSEDEPDRVISPLLNWGSSSGCFVLAGMVFALSTESTHGSRYES